MQAAYTVTRTGLGTRLQRVIHHTLDILPIPERTRTAIKNCPGCNRRVARLDRLTTGKGRGPDHHPHAGLSR
jgi:hypothetical protein